MPDDSAGKKGNPFSGTVTIGGKKVPKWAVFAIGGAAVLALFILGRNRPAGSSAGGGGDLGAGADTSGGAGGGSDAGSAVTSALNEQTDALKKLLEELQNAPQGTEPLAGPVTIDYPTYQGPTDEGGHGAGWDLPPMIYPGDGAPVASPGSGVGSVIDIIKPIGAAERAAEKAARSQTPAPVTGNKSATGGVGPGTVPVGPVQNVPGTPGGSIGDIIGAARDALQPPKEKAKDAAPPSKAPPVVAPAPKPVEPKEKASGGGKAPPAGSPPPPPPLAPKEKPGGAGKAPPATKPPVKPKGPVPVGAKMR